MPLSGRTRFALVVAFATLCSGQAAAQTTYPNVKVNGRLQEQFYYFDNDPYASVVGSQSNFFTRRARIEARGQIAENITVFIQPSFEGGRAISTSTACKPIIDDQTGGPDTLTVSCTTTGSSGIRLRDAWIDVRFTKPESKTAIYLRAGQEKRPFGRYELTSSNNLPSIERGAGKGLVGNASNDLFTSQGFLSHDVGAHLRLDYKLDDLRHVVLLAGAYNGRGESLNDNNNAKSFGFRGTAGVWSKLDVGASFFSHDGIVGTDSSFTNTAWGVDASWGKPGDEGVYLVGDYMEGKDATPAKNTMRGISGAAAYNYRMKSPTSWLYAIEPAFRFDYSDPNTSVGGDRTTLITGVLGFYLSSRAQLRVGYEHQSFQASGAKSIDGVRSALTVNF